MDIDKIEAGREMDLCIQISLFDDYAEPEVDYSGIPHNLYPDITPYSTDISATWLVEGKCSSFSLERIEYFPSVWWVCKLTIDGLVAEASGDTAPLAICRAALKAIDG